MNTEHVYSLPELVGLAEQHNPLTRAAWTAAKQQAAQLRIAQSELLPALTALALANTQRDGVLMDGYFARETIGAFEPLLQVDYLIFDGGGRAGRIREARARLQRSNFSFNHVHLDVLYQTAQAYYHVLDTIGQRDAAKANFENADTVRKAIAAQLAVGLATKPDALEADAQADQANFQLVTAEGNVDLARAGLLTVIGASPLFPLRVEPLSTIAPPPTQSEAQLNPQEAIRRALSQRPEIGESFEDRNAAQARTAQARSAYFPQLNFDGNGGEARVFGQQNQLPSSYVGPSEFWNVTVQLKWDLFDGGRREAEIVRDRAAVAEAEAQIRQARDEVEQQVVTAFVLVRTAYSQREAAHKSLASAQLSYDSSLQSYALGLRSTVAVVSAQRALAQARSADVTAQTNLLLQIAFFAYRTGDLQKTRVPKVQP